jgi:hypothetical protein
MLFLLLAGSHDRAIRKGSLVAHICDRTYMRLKLGSESHICAIACLCD